MRSILVRERALGGSTELRIDGQPWDSARFEAFCRDNPDVSAELDSEGKVIVMAPANADADGRNSLFLAALVNWAVASNAGKPFGPTAGFTLPNGAVRSPDASLVTWSAWNNLTVREKKSFAPLCPVFVMELWSSDDDSLADLKGKMDEYVANGARLGWLIDPITRHLHVYRPGRNPEVVEHPATYSAEPELPGFLFNFSVIWEA